VRSSAFSASLREEKRDVWEVGRGAIAKHDLGIAIWEIEGMRSQVDRERLNTTANASEIICISDSES
jgi:hypothetical protein